MSQLGGMLTSQKARVQQMMDGARQYHVQGLLAKARELYREVLKLVPSQPDAVHLLGVAEFQAGNLAEAERLLARAAKLCPHDANVLVNLGSLHKQMDRLPKAARAYREAIRLNPDFAVAHYNLGGVYYAQEAHELAIPAYMKALSLNPTYVEAMVNLGNIYKYRARRGADDWITAMNWYERALAIKPDAAEAYGNMGSVFRDRDWLYAARLMYDRALELAPNQDKFRFKRALVALPVGHLAQGWDDYEFRFAEIKDGVPRRPGAAYWQGEDLTGKSIFIWPEQGLGDQILFGSMLPDLIARGGKVILECERRLASIFGRTFPEIEILPVKDLTKLADPGSVDYQLPLTSLGCFFRRSFTDFPRHKGYLKIDRDKASALRVRYERLAAGRRVVGLSWRSKNQKLGLAKSTELLAWESILRQPNVMFVNLQYGDCRADLAEIREKLGVDIFQDREVDPMGDLDDFFAQVSALDLVISTSNTTVHVAGSVNVPTWVILPRGSGSLWYWFLGRDDSPWYPSLRLFRKKRRELEKSWTGVLAEVAAALERWVRA